MAVKQDIRVERSRDAIESAFMTLMKQKAYEEITVKDLAEAARINRKTFYAHYESKQALFESMMWELFDEIISCFMYEKKGLQKERDEQSLLADIRRFLTATEKYREQLDIMITMQTAGATFALAEQVIMNRLDNICMMPEIVPGKIPTGLYVSRLKNFFVGTMDWWLEQQDYTLEEAARILEQIMRTDIGSVFCYQ